MSAVRLSESAVRESVAVARSHGEKFFEQIVWQVENEAWKVLGYPSWDVMREAEYAGLGVTAPRADRPELVTRLRAKGLTQQQIASTVGASIGTVNSDLKFSSENERPTALTNSRGQERPASYQRRTEPSRSAEADVALVNDIRLYLGHIATSTEVANLAPRAKQHIIESLESTIEALRG